MYIERITVGSMKANCYLVIDEQTKVVAIVDPGDDPEYIVEFIIGRGYMPSMIIATHGHFDHIMGAFAIQCTFSIPFYIHTADVFLLARMQETAQHFLGVSSVDPSPINVTNLSPEPLHIGSSRVEVIGLPGHTPGSVGLYMKKESVMIVGDTIFSGGAIGRTDFSYSSKDDLEKSLKRILSFDNATVLLPGHGEKTTVLREKDYHG